MTLAELVEKYLAQHQVDPVTTTKLRWLLSKSVAAFGDLKPAELLPDEIGVWRMTIPEGHRFEATQALRQVLDVAVRWRLIRLESGEARPEPRAEAEREAAVRVVGRNRGRRGRTRPGYGPMILFAAATGMRPEEWIALERRDVDREARVVYVRRAFSKARLKEAKTEDSVRAVPLQRRALDALDALDALEPRLSRLVFPALRGGYLDLHNFRSREWNPIMKAAGIEPRRRIYDLRHTFATFALRAGISTFDLSRYMGTSLEMIDRTYGHLARDAKEHAIGLLDEFAARDPAVIELIRR